MFTQDLATKILLVIIADALGFAFGLLLDRVKANRERKEISWEKSYDAGMVAIRSDIRKKVSILYNAEKVDSLSLLRCRIENTGKKTVKSQRLTVRWESCAVASARVV